MSEGSGMSDTAALGLALVGGMLLGAFYFGTLWLLVRRLHRLAWPAAWLGAAGILRLAVVVALLYRLAGDRWEHLVVALVGFLAVRVVLTRWLGRPADRPRGAAEERAATADGGGSCR
jgi:F1F0 ATPase subunit 2